MATFQVQYPSGRTFSITGFFQLSQVGDFLFPLVETAAKSILLDPRAIVRRGGVEIYNPRRNMDGLQKEMREWLQANNQWGKR